MLERSTPFRFNLPILLHTHKLSHHASKYQVPCVPRAHLLEREEKANNFNNGVRHYDCKGIGCPDCYKLFKQ